MEPVFPLEVDSQIKVRITKDMSLSESSSMHYEKTNMIIVKLRDLEIALQEMERITEHEVSLESYPTPANIAATILYAAHMEHDDIENKIICDLGCGDGVFTIGAALLGAGQVIGIDLHSKALKAARRNSLLFETAKVNLVLGDVNSLALRNPIDTVVSNPPFGTKKRGADLEFLRVAISIAKVVYSIHLAGETNRKFLSDAIGRLGGSISQIETFQFPIPKIYKFHRKNKHLVNVDLYRITVNESE